MRRKIILLLCLCLLLKAPLTAEAAEVRRNGGVNAQDFHILEIVPHKSCSLFAYLVGGMEDQTPLGEEGILRAAQMTRIIPLFNEEGTSNKVELRPYTVLRNARKTATLHSDLSKEKPVYSYLTTTSVDSADAADKWRMLKTGEVKNKSGYFEYVGTGGLYNLPNKDQLKISYEVCEKGSYGFQKILQLSPRVEEGSVGAAEEKKTGYDFEAVFGWEKTAEFTILQNRGIYGFSKTAARDNRYKVVHVNKNQESGDYFLNAQNRYEYVEDRDAMPTGTEYWDVIFRKDSGSDPDAKYYIEEIKIAKKDGEGTYCIRGNEWDTVYRELGKEKGVYEAYVTGMEEKSITGEVTSGNGWIWVEEEGGESKKMPLYQYTGRTAAGFRNGRLEQGTRIYLTNVSFPEYKYVKNDYKNNEWFKLLCLGWDYDNSKTPLENVNRAEKEGYLDSWNIIITQKTPANVKMEDLEKADLIHISASEGVTNLSAQWETLTGKKETMPVTFETDINNFGMVQYLYEQYYNRSKAILLDVDMVKESNNSNIYKLYSLFGIFTDPDVFSNFFNSLNRPSGNFTLSDTYSWKNPVKGNFMQINPDGSLLVAEGKGLRNPMPSNVGWSSSKTVGSGENWAADYFVPKKILEENQPRAEGIYPGFIQRDNTFDKIVNKYNPGRPYMFLHWWGAGFLENILNMDEVELMLGLLAKPVISFPNAQMEAGENPVIYIDTFQDLFHVDYKVQGRKKNITKVEIIMEEGYGTVSETVVHTKQYPNGSTSVIEQNHLKPNNVEQKNTELNFEPESSGYSSEVCKNFLPVELTGGMYRGLTIRVTYSIRTDDDQSESRTISNTITVKVRDSFLLN